MTNPLRIAFLSPFVLRMTRGIERFTVNLANQLANLDQEVTIIARSTDGVKASPTISPEVRVRRVPAIRYYESRWDIAFYAAELIRRRYQIVNVFFAGYGEAEALRLARHVRPFAINFIAGYPFEQSPHQFHEFVRHGLARHLDGVVVKSQFMAPEVERFFGRKVEVIPNGVDLSYFSRGSAKETALGAQLSLQPDDKVLLTVAALEERKGILSVLDALPLVLEREPRVRYLIVGEGRDRELIERRISELGLRPRVQLMGAQADVRPFYRLADIFLLPSYGEGFPNVLLEALAMELPVIVSRRPPYDELVQPEFGLRVNEQDRAAVADAICSLLQNPARRKSMGLAGCAHVRSTFAWDAVANRYLQAFRGQLEARDHRIASNGWQN
jgi:glycosyltransferase involved in cell wall biosynthesis